MRTKEIQHTKERLRLAENYIKNQNLKNLEKWLDFKNKKQTK